MSIYTVPALNAVNFALTAHTVPSIASPANALQAYTVPSLAAVNFALVVFTVPTYMDIGWELLPGGFPTQYSGLRYWDAGIADRVELCLVAEADAPSGMGGVLKIRKGGVTYAVYLVETSDPSATPVRIKTIAGIKAIRVKT